VRSLALLLTMAASQASADEKTILATGEWSEPVAGLRGRLTLAQGRTLADGKARESLVYVELENVANTHSGVVSVQFDPDALRCDLTDSAGKAVPPAPVFGSGERPGKTSVSIPFDSSVRLRANPYAFGRAEGMLIHLNTASWQVTGDGEYHLAGTLTVTPPKGVTDVWKGELKLPKATFSLKLPTKKDVPSAAEPTRPPRPGRGRSRRADWWPGSGWSRTTTCGASGCCWR
jgi:hypothetical protein